MKQNFAVNTVKRFGDEPSRFDQSELVHLCPYSADLP